MFIMQTTGLALFSCAVTPDMKSSHSSKKLGIQLYSLREIIDNDPENILQRLSEIGFTEIETYGLNNGKLYGLTPEQLNNILIKYNLKSPSGHYGLERMLSGNFNELAEVIEIAKSLGQRYITIPSIPENLRQTEDDYLKIAQRLNEGGKICQESNLELAYHNHDFEFTPMASSKKTGYEILLDNTEKDLVHFEMDIYWVIRSGFHPIQLFEKYPGRFKLLHIKDMDKINPELNTEIGNGSINYHDILKNIRNESRLHYIIEQENFDMDYYKSLKKSIAYLKTEI